MGFFASARDGHALLLAAGELRREILHPLAQAHLLEHLLRRQRLLADLRRQLDVLERRQVLHEVVKLEHKAHHAAAVERELALAVLLHMRAVHDHLAAGGAVHAAQDVQKRRLARAGRADDHAQLALFHLEGHAAERVDHDLAHVVLLFDVPHFDICHPETSAAVLTILL